MLGVAYDCYMSMVPRTMLS